MMNISTQQIPIHNTIPQKNVAGSFSPKFHTSSNEVVASAVSGSASSEIKETANTTYQKPLAVNVSASQPEGESPQGDAVNKHANDEETSQQHFSPVSDEQPENHDVYSEAELAQIDALKVRDAEVSAHERAHSAVGGQHAGSPNYSYKTGPDGVKYAVSGEVSIDTSSVPGDPQATLQKAQQIKAAALAPMEPSGQDRKVAAKAERMAAQARSELLATSRGDEENSHVSHSHTESSVPEHFTGTTNLSINNQMNETVQLQMNARNFHINHLYQSIATTPELPNLEIQV